MHSAYIKCSWQHFMHHLSGGLLPAAVRTALVECAAALPALSDRRKLLARQTHGTLRRVYP